MAGGAKEGDSVGREGFGAQRRIMRDLDRY